MNDLFGAEKLDAGDTGAISADVYGLRKFNKFRPGNISSSNENRNLKAKTGRTASWRGLQVLVSFKVSDPTASQGWYQRTSTNLSISDARRSVLDGQQNDSYQLIARGTRGKGSLGAGHGAGKFTFLSTNVQVERIYH